jgi:5-methylcytosine-specific restriction endonuclease McrA
MNRPEKAVLPPREEAPLTETDKRYKTTAWTWLSKLVRSQNPICQRIRDDGRGPEQCRYASRMVHHHHSPKDRPDLMLSVYDEAGSSNLVALCLQCHNDSPGTFGTWIEGRDFVRTNFTQRGKL